MFSMWRWRASRSISLIVSKLVSFHAWTVQIYYWMYLSLTRKLIRKKRRGDVIVMCIFLFFVKMSIKAKSKLISSCFPSLVYTSFEARWNNATRCFSVNDFLYSCLYCYYIDTIFFRFTDSCTDNSTNNIINS